MIPPFCNSLPFAALRLDFTCSILEKFFLDQFCQNHYLVSSANTIQSQLVLTIILGPSPLGHEPAPIGGIGFLAPLPLIVFYTPPYLMIAPP